MTSTRLKGARRVFIVVVIGTPVLLLCLNMTNFIGTSLQDEEAIAEEYVTEVVEVEPICDPSRNIFFFKTHKTGSSTVFNVFMRYAEEKNLTVAVCRDPSNMLKYPAMLNPTNLPNYSLINRHVEIFAIHTRLDMRQAKRLMAPRTKFITILRDPIHSWSSGFNYFNLPAVTGFSLKEFLNDEDAVDRMKKRNFSPWFGFNFVYYDLGFNETLTDAPAAQAQTAIDMLEENFNLVMISELMDESLILMRHALCWELEDIVGFRHNERNSTVHSRELDSDLFSKISDLNDIDVRIYNHFLKKLQEKIEKFGIERMEKEVHMLRLRRDFWFRQCVGGYRHGFQQTLEFVPKDSGPSRCQRLTRSETRYVVHYRKMYRTEFEKTPHGKGQIK